MINNSSIEKSKRLFYATSIIAMMVLDVIATPTITGVTAQQRYPWNGKVDISYTVAGDVPAGATLKVMATDRTANNTYTATKLSGDRALTAGTHSVVWDMDAEGLAFKSTNVVFRITYEIVSTEATYCIIDLSAGPDASSYPVSYMTSPPSGGFNTDEYKTTKLVLRRIEAGTFIMGDDQTDESHRVTLTKSFFCGLFEVTIRQYSLVMGSNPSDYTNDTLPVEKVSYNDIRGTSDGAKWPSAATVDSVSFIGKLRTRTGLDFDLPTEAQWEYACRAGTTTTYSYGNLADGSYMWYYDNYDYAVPFSGRKTHFVGLKSPNLWGLYDMHGNVWEWCLDWYADGLSGGSDPKGSTSGSDRVLRGGSWSEYADRCTSSYRFHGNTSCGNNSYDLDYGFRLVRTLSN